ncbi:UPF0575 protein C19orf67 homolog, partial [Oncorhynchus keta]|uniref:UPF0575 protein C19orf67 homolog n=1 Tax=Oncorhynchus keta TaxID=8018 RepID=UPI00227D6627
VSHFYIGKCQIDSVGLSIYRYCRLAPYLAGVHTGLYKRMRWNVERPRGGDGEGKGETVAIGNMVKMWSIGQWIQTYPDPVRGDINDWVLCWIPQARYHRLLCLGGEEPSACNATDCLLGALFSQQSPVEGPSRETT